MQAGLLIRWAVKRDTDAMVDIDRQSYAKAWGEESFIKHLKNRACIGLVAESEGRIVGFVIYELAKKSLAVLRIAVHPAERRKGVGKAILERLAGKLTKQIRLFASISVGENDQDAMEFLRACGLKARELYPADPPENGGDVWVFHLECPERSGKES
jgi:ribosomal-protein-alanine N-acetyltransferase